MTLNYCCCFDQNKKLAPQTLKCALEHQLNSFCLTEYAVVFNESLNTILSCSLTTSWQSPFYFPPRFSTVFDFVLSTPRLRGRVRSCIVGVCCLSARAKIDSKLQSLLRTPRCAARPQNNTQTNHSQTHIQTWNAQYAVLPLYFPFSLLERWANRRSHVEVVL